VILESKALALGSSDFGVQSFSFGSSDFGSQSFSFGKGSKASALDSIMTFYIF